MPINVTDTLNISILEKIQTVLINLPKKEKTEYAILEAESFLHRWVYKTLKKNYTIAEIDNVFLNAGWPEDCIELFWKFYERREEKRRHKKTTPTRLSHKTTKVSSNENVHQDIPMPQLAQKNDLENMSEGDGLITQLMPENPQLFKGAHFELQPDTEDI